jgi:rare lipoprotein A
VGYEMLTKIALRLCVLIVTGLVLAACAEGGLIIHAAKQAQGGRSGPPGSGYKVGNPYQINGVWYYPAEDYGYSETGIASWYGPGFHGKKTANGETYDQNDITAAHRTLPMPSLVKVTNLENGRELKVRINDRGPYAHGRIIDLSRRSAQLLGVEQSGTARVKVEILADESRQMAAAAGANIETNPPGVTAAPRDSVVAQSLPPPPGGKGMAGGSQPPAQAAPPPINRPKAEALPDLRVQDVRTVPVGPTNLFVQAGAFSRFDNANKVKAKLSNLGSVNIMQHDSGGQPMFRVRLGPIQTTKEADAMLEKVVATGYPEARIIVD